MPFCITGNHNPAISSFDSEIESFHARMGRPARDDSQLIRLHDRPVFMDLGDIPFEVVGILLILSNPGRQVVDVCLSEIVLEEVSGADRSDDGHPPGASVVPGQEQKLRQVANVVEVEVSEEDVSDRLNRDPKPN